MGYIEDLRALVGHRPLILPGSAVIIRDGEGRLLVQERVYPKGKWAFPGGLMELGESTEDTARREIFEETGLRLGRLHLIGVYSGTNYLCRAENGDEWYVVTTAYWTDEYEGEASVADHESLSFAWLDPHAMPEGLARTHSEFFADYLAMTEQRTGKIM